MQGPAPFFSYSTGALAAAESRRSGEEGARAGVPKRKRREGRDLSEGVGDFTSGLWAGDGGRRRRAGEDRRGRISCGAGGVWPGPRLAVPLFIARKEPTAGSMTCSPFRGLTRVCVPFGKEYLGCWGQFFLPLAVILESKVVVALLPMKIYANEF
jgi:hypothetical protein